MARAMPAASVRNFSCQRDHPSATIGPRTIATFSPENEDELGVPLKGHGGTCEASHTLWLPLGHASHLRVNHGNQARHRKYQAIAIGGAKRRYHQLPDHA